MKKPTMIGAAALITAGVAGAVIALTMSGGSDPQQQPQEVRIVNETSTAPELPNPSASPAEATPSPIAPPGTAPAPQPTTSCVGTGTVDCTPKLPMITLNPSPGRLPNPLSPPPPAHG